jgi:hypothetical protein
MYNPKEETYQRSAMWCNGYLDGVEIRNVALTIECAGIG